MKKSMILASAMLLASCGSEASAEYTYAPSRVQTSWHVVTDWSGDDEGWRVSTVDTPGGKITCIERKDVAGSGSSYNVSVAISCDWNPK